MPQKVVEKDHANTLWDFQIQTTDRWVMANLKDIVFVDKGQMWQSQVIAISGRRNRRKWRSIRCWQSSEGMWSVKKSVIPVVIGTSGADTQSVWVDPASDVQSLEAGESEPLYNGLNSEYVFISTQNHKMFYFYKYERAHTCSIFHSNTGTTWRHEAKVSCASLQIVLSLPNCTVCLTVNDGFTKLCNFIIILLVKVM